ncbi:glycosyltransferase family 2 protein [Niabella insulamsoli]|uniref:glycosyltransferase family 2 protein n=1 Tax=Niabella insulamsoli TaxID=3144874 RepID=UPI0031FD1A67
MNNLSVVILTKNAQATISAAVDSALLVTHEVIVVDSGSADNTLKIAEQQGARVICIQWKGYGDARNSGAAEATNAYILNIDADEVITEQLAESINQLQPEAKTIYGFKRMNYLGTKEIKHGEWSNDRVWRLYNKNETRWNLSEVHEKLDGGGFRKTMLRGALRHFTADSIASYQKKMDGYARLSAKKYRDQHKKIGWGKTLLSPLFNLVKNYIFRLGILDGKAGWDIAKAHFQYTRNKYLYLRRLKEGKPETT